MYLIRIKFSLWHEQFAIFFMSDLMFGLLLKEKKKKINILQSYFPSILRKTFANKK